MDYKRFGYCFIVENISEEFGQSYYYFMMNGKRMVEGISVLDEKYLNPFKAKAWCELIERRRQGEEGQTRHIVKHCKDIVRLVALLPPNTKVNISGMIREEILSAFFPGTSNRYEQ